MTTVTRSSTAARRQLGRQLRELREHARMTREDVAVTQLMSRGKLETIESGRKAVKPGDVTELCRLYRAGPDTTEALREMSLATDLAAWWQGEDLSGQGFDVYLGLEEAAAECWTYAPALIHGLLQTEDYARVVERTNTLRGVPDAVSESYVQVRMRRQRTLFDRSVPLRLHVVLNEAALRTQIGGAQVMDAQLQHLRDLSQRDDMEIRVLPFAAGAHEAVIGGFTIFGYTSSDDPPVVHAQWYGWARYSDRPANVLRLRAVYEAIHTRSVPIEEYTP
jgi:transcriptional regulator with XRE-family HTH domain